MIFYRSPAGSHRHYCLKCNVVWEHADACSELPARKKLAAHKCPKCGEKKTFKYLGHLPPTEEQTQCTGSATPTAGYSISLAPAESSRFRARMANRPRLALESTG